MKTFKTLYRKSLVQVELPQIEAFIQLIIKDAKKYDGIDTELLESQLIRIKDNENDEKETYLFMYSIYQYSFYNRGGITFYYTNTINETPLI
jgi:hypothetical protein